MELGVTHGAQSSAARSRWEQLLVFLNEVKLDPRREGREERRGGGGGGHH